MVVIGETSTWKAHYFFHPKESANATKMRGINESEGE